MFQARQPRSPVTWHPIEDDFLLGACPRRIIGFATRASDGRWSAFDEESRPLGEFKGSAAAKDALWASHADAHATDCAPVPVRVVTGLTQKMRALHT